MAQMELEGKVGKVGFRGQIHLTLKASGHSL